MCACRHGHAILKKYKKFYSICSPYNLTTALYAETETQKYASVVVVVPASSSIERFENLRGKKACIAEFGSIGKIYDL